MTERIEAQIERFAPGFRDLIVGPFDLHRRGRGGAQSELRRRGHQRGRGARSARWSSGRPCSGTPTARRSVASILRSAATPPAAASTACAGWGRPAPPSTTSAWVGARTPSDLMGRTTTYAWYWLRSTMGTGALLLPLRHPPRGRGGGSVHRRHRGGAEHRVLLCRLRGGARTSRSSSSLTASSTRVSGSTRPTTPRWCRTLSHLPHVERVESTVELNLGPLSPGGRGRP